MSKTNLSKYKAWADLTEAQRKQVRDKLKSKKKWELSQGGMKYDLDENENFNGSYLDPYMLMSAFSLPRRGN